MKINKRPLLTYTVIVIIVMVGLGILLAQLTRSYFINIFEERIAVESNYFASYLEEFLENDELSQDSLIEFSEQLNTGMIFISAEDEVIIDTVETLPMISNAEKQAIIDKVQLNQLPMREGQLEETIFYYPLPINIGGENGTLLVVSPVQSLADITKNIWLLIGFTLILGLLAIFIIGFNVFSKFIRPIRSASKTANELAEGNYNARTYEGHFGEAGQLSRSINVLARNLQEMTSTKGMQENQLEAVINNMGSGLILIDEKGYILLVNKAFLESFGGNQKEYIGFLYHDAIPYTAIHETVQTIYMFEETVSEKFVLPVQIDRKHLEVTGAPIFSENKKWKGIVLVFHDITDMKKLEQMRKDFVANVSHELKTPITSIRGFSETLLDGAMRDEAMLDQFLRIILKEGGRLQSLIEDLLELSKVEKEDFKLLVEQVELHKLLSELLPIVEQQAEKKSIRLEALMDRRVVIQGDASRLKQVFMNLLANAVNYTGEEGLVEVTLEDHEETVVISIKDNGVGIPEEEISRIFERFYRVDKARSRNSGGTGLGLAIVKHIIEAHHGTIRVDSEVSKGTTFEVTLPKEFTNN
ncbi:two-component system histidine kinase PnpS [Halobacillus amylolyticus]|uniref:histidine kinase n=1 Tax=Halobacillus amylolyticus TaxID=2932259 RepID=A0ABY4HC26_9BACI|nr:ATP-binding protein [Halobacillus amylolyticus]UOR11953.1 ATP-binding protein [Halobacillus amylolyticus]